jgi:hypothetical protein
MAALKHFYFVVFFENSPEEESTFQDTNRDWSSHEEFYWDARLRTLAEKQERDSGEEAELAALLAHESHARKFMEILEGIHRPPPVEKDENGGMTSAGQVDEVLRRFEAQIFAGVLDEQSGSERERGVLRLRFLCSTEALLTKTSSHFRSNFQRVFDKEKVANPGWE